MTSVVKRISERGNEVNDSVPLSSPLLSREDEVTPQFRVNGSYHHPPFSSFPFQLLKLAL